jgi:cell division protease FtsH
LTGASPSTCPTAATASTYLQIHARKKPLAEDVNLEVIAERTPGFSGADLFSLMNEGAILAARENRKTVAQYDLIRSIEKVMLGPERKQRMCLNKKEKEITAYHEAGHALVASGAAVRRPGAQNIYHQPRPRRGLHAQAPV